jgi:uncharacterized membrane protein
MPVARQRATGPGGPALHLILTPHRPLTEAGFRALLLAAFLGMLIPMVALLGTPMLWVILGFALAVLGLLWALMRQHARAAVTEELVLTEDSLQVTRRGPRGGLRDWRSNPHWTRVELHETGGPVESYLTLAGGGRTIELGAFLSPEERVALGRELRVALADLPGYPFAAG